MKNLTRICLLLLLFLVWQGAEGGTLSFPRETADCNIRLIDESSQEQRPDGLTDLSQRESNPVSATLTDAREFYRLCNTRPQRITQTWGSKLRTSCRFFTYHPFKLTLKPTPSREVMPFMAYTLKSASCSYYVIALRHILC